jgi:hypothetical protein
MVNKSPSIFALKTRHQLWKHALGQKQTSRSAIVMSATPRFGDLRLFSKRCSTYKIDAKIGIIIEIVFDAFWFHLVFLLL